MVELRRDLDPEVIRRNLDEIRAQLPDPARTTVLAAVKYVPVEELGALAEAGVTHVGENRAQDLAVKRAAWDGRAAFVWDFIGHLQSRKVKDVLPLVRWIHSVSTPSVVDQLARRAPAGTEALVEVNVARDPAKSGVLPEELPRYLDALRETGTVAPVGLMTMPPLAREPEDSRRWFAALAQLAADHGLPELSMGTTQDFAVAAQEGATIVRIGTRLVEDVQDRAAQGLI
ncbi:MAG TPA: YggS family pyridoxal phosphate enzyme [Baekduia sp.]|nr:YggS family pyridoxal phosphate enzyme [Baekduia sp.]